MSLVGVPDKVSQANNGAAAPPVDPNEYVKAPSV
jgi:hypothetical protein